MSTETHSSVWTDINLNSCSCSVWMGRSLPLCSVTSLQWSLACASRMAGSRPMELDSSPPSVNSRWCVVCLLHYCTNSSVLCTVLKCVVACAMIHIYIATHTILKLLFLRTSWQSNRQMSFWQNVICFNFTLQSVELVDSDQLLTYAQPPSARLYGNQSKMFFQHVRVCTV